MPATVVQNRQTVYRAPVRGNRRTVPGTLLGCRPVRAPGPGLRALFFVCLAALASSLPAAGAEPADRLRGEADELRRTNESLAGQVTSVQAELGSLDAQLAGTRARLARLRARGERLARKQAEARAALNSARAGVRVSQRRLADRLRALYEQGKPEPLAVILGAETLDDAVSGVEHLTRIADDDRLNIERARAARTKLIRVTAVLAQREAENESLRAAASDAAATLVRVGGERAGGRWNHRPRDACGGRVGAPDGRCHRLFAAGPHRQRNPGRPRSRRRRSGGDPDRNAPDDSRLRPGHRRRHGQRDHGSANRLVVLVPGGRPRLGPAVGHDRRRRVVCRNSRP